jgi:hypothetical protein
MKKFVTLIFATMALMACASGNYPATAASGPNLLIMGEDADPNSIPRKNRAFKRVEAALSNEFGDNGYRVYDETLISLENFKQGRIRRSDAEIIDIAKSIENKRIDIIVVFTVYPRFKKLSYVTKSTPRIEARLLNVRSGRKLGNFEIVAATRNLSSSCDRSCIIEDVGSQAKEIAQDVGAVLVKRLERYTRSSATSNSTFSQNSNKNMTSEYTVIINGFRRRTVREIEDMLFSLPSYIGHQILQSSSKNAKYTYETEAKTGPLIRALEKILDTLDLEGIVRHSGDTIRVRSTVMNQ